MFKNKAVTEYFDSSRLSKPYEFKPKKQEVSFQLCWFGQQNTEVLLALQKQITFRAGVLLSFYGHPPFN